MKPGILLKIQCDNSRPEWTRVDDSDIYFRVRQKFHRVAQRSGWKSIEDFVSEDPDYLKQNDMLDDGDDDERTLIEEEEFFDPDGAIAVVAYLADYVNSHQGEMHMAKASRFLGALDVLLTDVRNKQCQFHLTFELGAM